MSDQFDQIAAALADRYALERELGAGGMATVYLAEDLKHKRKVAVKVLRPDIASSVGPTRFVREIDIAAQLHHPHILPLYDSGEARGPDGSGPFLYYVMPYVDGESLREKLDRDGQMPVAEAVHILKEVVDALAEAHAQGVVHRDIKPDNVMLSGRHASVMDFGVAKAVSEAGGDVTATGIALGTPTYMAPEQAAAEPTIDHRADIYALGVMAYEMLTGRPPFTGASHQAVLVAHVTRAVEPVGTHRTNVPEALSEIVMRCLEKQPADRWQSAEDLLPPLDALGTPSGGVTPTAVKPATMRTRMSPIRVAAIVGAVAVVGTVAALLLVGGNNVRFEVGRTTELTREPGLEIEPAISPDGRLVAYAAGPVGRMLVYVRQLAGGRPIALAGNLGGHQRRPQWSPDGEQISFLSGGSIYLVPALGGAPRRIGPPTGEQAHSPTWSPSGEEIAYVVDSLVHVQATNGGERRAVAHAVGAHSVQWSPDGSMLAYVSGNIEFIYATANFANIAPSAIWVASIGDGEPVRVTDNASLNVSPVWAPDGRTLLFVSNQGGSRDIYQVSVSTAGAPTGQARRLTTGLNAHTISLTAEGRQLTYSVFTYEANIWSVEIPEGRIASVTEAEPVTLGNQAIEGLSVSPDGRWLAFDSDRTGNQDIYRRPLGGGELEQLTTHPSDDFLPVWSPDGSEIVFYSFRNGTRDIYTMSADGGQLQQLTDDPRQERSPDWSSDGQSIVFYWDRSGRYEVYTMSRTNDGSGWTAPQQLTFDGGGNPRWSPDGRWIAYLNEQDSMSVMLVSPTGGTPTVLVTSRDPDVTPRPEELRWAPDGQTLYYKAYDAEGTSSIWSVSVNGGPPSLRVRFDDPTRQSNRDDFAVDDRRLYFTAGTLQSDVWVMELLRR